MARVPEIIRRNPVSQVAAQPAKAGQGFAALAQLAKIGENFVRPAAIEEAKLAGQKSVYRDADGSLKVDARSALGGEMAAMHNSAAYAKYLSQKQIDMSESFTEMAQKYEFDPAGFKDASDGYISIMQEDEDIPAVLKDDLLLGAQQEASRRFNGLYNAETKRNYNEADRNTKTARDMLVDDYVSLYTGGDFEGAAAKMEEIEAITQFRSDAPYISETPAENEAYLRGARGDAKAAHLIRELIDLEGATSISEEKRAEIQKVIDDEDIDPKDRNALYTATQGRLKGIDASAIVKGLTDTSISGVVGNFNWNQHRTAGGLRSDAISGMEGKFRSSLEAMITNAPSGIKDGLSVFSGYRSVEVQTKLWNDALRKYGSVAAARNEVAPPGKSQHNFGRAADLRWNGKRLDSAPKYVRDWVHSNAGKFGLNFPMSWEPWHIELNGARGSLSASQAESNKVAISEAGLVPTGGSEFIAGIVNPDTAIKLFKAEDTEIMSDVFSEGSGLPDVVMGMTVREAKQWAERKAVVKASDITAQQITIDRIEDQEVRGMASAELSRRYQVQKRLEAAARLVYEERLKASDDTLSEQEIVEDNGLADSDQSILVAKLQKVRKDQIEVQQTIADLNSGVFFNIGESKDKNRIDDFFKASTNGEDPLSAPEHMATAAQVNEVTGFIPKSMFDALRGAASSDDPLRLATAMEFANRVLEDSATALGNYGGRKEVTDALSDYKFFSQFNSGEAAAQKMIDAREDIPKNLTDQAKAAAKDLDVSDIIDHFDTSWFSDPTIGSDGISPIEPGPQENEMMATYTRLFKDAFVDTGDAPRSKSRALDEMGRIYGVNQVTGSSRVMKFPPQIFSPQIDGSHDWMRDQLESDLSQLVFGDVAEQPMVIPPSDFIAGSGGATGGSKWINAESVNLVSDATTQAQISRGETPSYIVYYMLDGQVEQATKRFAFDGKSLAYDEVADEKLIATAKRKEVDDARDLAIRRQAKTGGFSGFAVGPDGRPITDPSKLP